MEEIRDTILKARAEAQERLLKGFAPVENESVPAQAEVKGNIFELFSKAIEKSESDDPITAMNGEIEKSDIMEAISYSDEFRFSKLGKEIKQKVKSDILPELQAKLQVASAEVETNLKGCNGAPTEIIPPWWTNNIKMEIPYRLFKWEDVDCCNSESVVNNLTGEENTDKPTAEECKCRRAYNESVRNYVHIAVDIKACEILDANLGDNVQYKLTPRQLSMFGF